MENITQEQFLEKQGKWFYIRLMKYFFMSTSQDEQDSMDDNYVLFFEFPEGRYSIKYIDLKQRADEETKQFLEEKNLQIPEFTIKGNNNIDYLIKLPTA